MEMPQLKKTTTEKHTIDKCPPEHNSYTWNGMQGNNALDLHITETRDVYVEKKNQLDVTQWFIVLWTTLHVSGTYMPIVRSPETILRL
jgi:hypothetical protein